MEVILYYHASQIKNLKILKPNISNHNIPLIYFSDKRENVLLYLSNAVEKFCKEQNFINEGSWVKWGPYGFDENGILRLDEYYPNALFETYKNVSGYIYSCEHIKEKPDFKLNILNVYVSEKETLVDNCEFIEDAYEEILRAESLGLIKVQRYEQFISKHKNWLINVINKEYSETNKIEYKFFLEKKFEKFLYR